MRQPFGNAGGTPGGPGADADLDASPTQVMVMALIKTIKNATTPTLATVVTPTNKPKRQLWDYLTPKETPHTRPAKKKAKQALGGYQQLGPSTPLTAPPELDPQEKHKSAVSKGKQLAKKYAKKKGKQAAIDVAKQWLTFD